MAQDPQGPHDFTLHMMQSGAEKIRKPIERPADPDARKKQLNLGVFLKSKQILGRSSHIQRQITVDPVDRLKLENRKREQSWKKTEEVTWGEWMIVEGADIDGVTKKSGNPNWFDSSVLAYLPSEYDDQLRGTDALLMFVDQEDESQAFPVGVDITTNPEEYMKKVSNDMFRTSTDRPSEIYWVDTKISDKDYAEGERNFTNIEEGKVQSVNASVYIPTDLIATYRNEKNTLAQADQAMELMGAFVLRQLRAELEAQALILTGEADADRVLHGEAFPRSVMSREQLIEKLRNPFRPQTLTKRRTAEILALTLETMMENERSWGKRMMKAAAKDSGFMLAQERLRKQLPQFVKRMEEMWEGVGEREQYAADAE